MKQREDMYTNIAQHLHIDPETISNLTPEQQELIVQQLHFKIYRDDKEMIQDGKK